MRLSKDVREKVLKTTRLKSLLALDMDKSIYSIVKWARENRKNNPLTTVGAIRIIAANTGLVEEEILVSEEVERV